MATWQERVVEEQNQLAEKIGKLIKFIALNPTFADLDSFNKGALRRQRDAMIAYSDALGDRIAEFELE